MNISIEIQALIGFILLVPVIATVIGYTGIKLADRNGTDIRVTWYLFSLAVVATFIATAWASSVGAIDGKGGFQGEIGSIVNAILKFMLDLEADLKIFSAILAIILFPQIASYILSGLFGCASAPIFVGGAIRFFIWSVVKSFVVAAGIFLSVALYGFFSKWNGWSAKGTASMLTMSGLLLMLSFSMLYLYRDVHAAIEKPSAIRFPGIQRMWARLQGWLTRKLP